MVYNADLIKHEQRQMCLKMLIVKGINKYLIQTKYSLRKQNKIYIYTF